ncbi:MAG TPA: PQQ-binding-like beta-propeller repeat protein [Pirellulales bacterium]|nr:PQQ-binding-like beta-propeller repeat protein [Pirellulales bacterium]
MCLGVGGRAVGLAVAAGILLGVLSVWPAAAHGPFAPRLDLSDALQVDEADAATRTHLEQVKAFVANEQWDEAVEILWQVPETHGGRLLPVSPWYFVNVRDYCHLQLAALPPEAIQLYRERVDSQARRWYDEGMRRRDAEALRHVVRQFFCSTWGDNALLALGDLALEAGNTGEARGYWKRILPPDYWALRAPPVVGWLLYPDTDLDRAAVRARLLLATVLEGEFELARHDLEIFRRECGAARGRMGGREINYVEFLDELLSEGAGWPAERVDRQWPTFGGSLERDKVLPKPLDVGAIAWEAGLPELSAAEASSTAGSRRVAEKRDQLLSYHPVIVDNLVLVNTIDDVRAYDRATGEPLWAESSDQAWFYKLPGERSDPGDNGRVGAMGAPRCTLTVRDRRVYARLGSPLTSRTSDAPILPKRSHLVCLDLDDEGSLIWNVSDANEEDERDRSWAFEGSPVVDGDGVYVAMRRSGVRPQQYVACFDPERGRLKWRRLICGAETPAQGQEEITHNLLTLHAGVLYCNTNLGAVAALDTRDGVVQWITRYPRAGQVDLNKRSKHFYRDLTPCVYDHGMVYVAPADSAWVLALDAPTGQLLWQTDFPEDAVHLLGVSGGRLVASGDKLWWIDALRGKIVSPPGAPGTECFPEGGSPKGLGRGLIADDKVYWPTWDKIYVFDQRADRQLEPIDLHVRGAVGGNLFPAGDSLLVASHDRLIAFSPESTSPAVSPTVERKLSILDGRSSQSGPSDRFPRSVVRRP